MATASTWVAIQNDILGLLKAVTFPGITKDAMECKKKVSIRDGDKLPAIRIVPYGDPEQDTGDFEGGAFNIYPVEICIATSGNLDYTQDDQQQSWLEIARRAVLRMQDGTNFFRTKLPNVPGVWNLEEETAATFDHSKLPQQYNYQSIVIRVHCQEGNN